MADARTCPKCGGAVPPDAVDGLCARCLARVAFGERSQKSEARRQRSEDAVAGPPAATIRVELEPDMLLEAGGGRIGRYKLLEKIGEGGFGLVYMAEQVEPVQRKVALKIIKAGMDTRQIIARFEAERQALALMDHPNIARVLDAGATETGRPYFVMELVKGIPITNYCDQYRLSPGERLQLFIKVCHAVQHAHQKGIIHRDLKPSNVLVTLHDGEPVPKVIDFGIAKALGQKLTEKTLFTGFEQMIGTPAYMSPEQAEISGLDVDTRSDVYSLGVLLYELLTGTTPFQKETLAKAALDEVRRMIRETEPPKPSTRLRTLGEKATEIAQQRHVEAAALSRLVRGDLDWIVMKCLEKDRTRRYETANGLANDIHRHLNAEPVTAAAPTVAYRTQKFIQRHKAGLAIAAALLLLLLTGVVVSTWQAVRATRAERAQARLRQQAEQARASETQLRRQAEQLTATAQDQARQISLQLYASHMNLAFQAWAKGQLGQVESLLNQHYPKPGDDDLRGFEWFYLWRLCHSAQLTLRGHSDRMRCVAFSPDGRLLATAGDDSTARIWDAHTGRELLVLRGHADGVTSAVFAPDGKTLATGGGDHTVRLWDAASGREKAVLQGHQNGVSGLAFGLAGKWLASATGRRATGATPSTRLVDEEPLEAEIQVWNLETRAVSQTITGHTRGILSLAASPDGKHLATASVDAKVRIWELQAGRMEAEIASLKGLGFAVAFSPDGKAIAVGGGDPRGESELKLWDMASAKEQMTYRGHEGPVLSVAFAPDGKTLASGGVDQTIRFWDVATGDELRTIRGHKAPIWSVAYDPAGQRIASASWDETVKVWDAVSPQGFQLLTNVDGYSSCFTPDGRFLVMSSGRGLEVVEPGAGKAPFLFPDYKANDLVVAMAPDGSVLASAGDDQKVVLWEVGTWRRLCTLEGHRDKIWKLEFSPDGRTLASSDGEMLRLWDVSRRAERIAVRPEITGGWGALVFTPDGRRVITSGDLGNQTAILDAASGQVQSRFTGTCLALAPNGRWLAVDRSGLALMDLATLELKWLTDPHRARLWSARFSPDGKTLATASWDGTAKLLATANGQEMFSYRAPGVVWSTSFSPNGEWWAVGSGSAKKGRTTVFRAATARKVEAANRPALLVHPSSRPVLEGAWTAFGVDATGLSPLAYQWRKDGNNLAGETNATLALAHVTLADAGRYSVLITNSLGSIRSSNASLSVIQVREQAIAEINFEDKQPSAGYSAYTYCQNPVPLGVSAVEVPGAGLRGGTGLVTIADRSGYTNNPAQGWAGFAGWVRSFANRASGLDTTNLAMYKLYATVKARGLAGERSHSRVQWNFLASNELLLSVGLHAGFTTNYQEFSFVLADGSFDPSSGGSWSKFLGHFDQIDRVECAVIADDWLTTYRADAENALCVGHVKFVRLVPVSPPSNMPGEGATPQPEAAAR